MLLRVKLRRRLQLHFYTGSQNSLQRTDLSVFTGSKRLVFCTKVWLEKHFSRVKSYENAATSASQDETSPLLLSFSIFVLCPLRYVMLYRAGFLALYYIKWQQRLWLLLIVNIKNVLTSLATLQLNGTWLPKVRASG